MPHGHGGHHEEEEDEEGEWMQLLRPSELREVQDLDRARKEVERQIIHSNQAKLAGRTEAERRGKTPGSFRIAGAGASAGRHDVMSQLYMQDVEVEHLAKLLPRPGDGEKQKQMAWQKMVDVANSILTGPWFGVITMAVTAASVCLYLYETTLDHDDNNSSGGGWFKTGHRYPDWFPVAEDAFLIFFAAELGLRAALADQDRSFWTSTESVVDVLAVLPSLLIVTFDLRLWGFLRFLRLFRWADISTIVDNHRKSRTNERGERGVGTTDEKLEGASEWKRQSMVAGLKLVAFVARFVLVYAGVALLLDRAEGGIEDTADADIGEPIEFTSAIYMAAMMLSTVGEGVYGPVPVSPLARVAASVAVLFFLPLAAIRVADVVKHSSTAKSAVRTVSLVPGTRTRHIVACGSVSHSNLKARLQELFHADHGMHNVRWVRIVVLSPEPPTQRINTLLEHPRYRGRVKYVQGSPLDDDSLRKAGVDDAAAVMVMANKSPASTHAEDMNLSLQAISVMTHVELERRQGYGPRLLVELVNPNAALHLQAAGINQVISSAQVKLSVLAQSCLCPGWSAVVANLLESRAALPPQVLQQGSWLAEYYVGAKKTFYSVEFSPAFTGVVFGDAAVHIFEMFELILVAVETKHGGDGGEELVMINPSGDYRIARGDRGFVLAESQADARVIWDYMAKDGSKGGALDEMGQLMRRFNSPEEEEALALETLGTAGIAGMGPQAFVDSMMFSRTLVHCQRKLENGEAPDTGLVLGWARQFQASGGMSDEMVVRKVLASAGMVPPRSIYLDSAPPETAAAAVMEVSARGTTTTAQRSAGGARGNEGAPAAAAAAATAAATAAAAAAAAAAQQAAAAAAKAAAEKEAAAEAAAEKEAEAVAAREEEAAAQEAAEAAAAARLEAALSASVEGSNRHQLREEDEYEEEQQQKHEQQQQLLDQDGVPREMAASSAESARTMPPPHSRTASMASRQASGAGSSVAGGGGIAGSTVGLIGEEVLSALRTMEVSSLTGEEACRRLLALRSAAKATPHTGEATPTLTTAAAAATNTTNSAPISTPVPTTPSAATASSTVPASGLVAGGYVVAPPPPPPPHLGGLSLNASSHHLHHHSHAAMAAAAVAAAAASAAATAAVVMSRRVKTARHLADHVVVLGFPARPSHLECFLRPLKGWTGGGGLGGGREVGGGGVPVVLVASNLDKLESALEVVDRNGYVNTSEVYLLEGSPVSQADLENAGVRTAKAVLVMKDPMASMGLSGDPLRDSEALVSFIKMEDGLLTPDQHVVVELENCSNVRFLHSRTDAKSLHAIAGLGGAGAGGAADEAHYLWPKYAAGMTYSSSFVDHLFGQAFYRRSRIALISSLLLLDRGERGYRRSGMASSGEQGYGHPSNASLAGGTGGFGGGGGGGGGGNNATGAGIASSAFGGGSSTGGGGGGGRRSSAGYRGRRDSSGTGEGDDNFLLDRECCLRQMPVPSSFLGHSFGEMFQHLAAPPLRCVAFALLRARGTRSAPEPYVYTGPRADTVLHRGDRVFVLGKPPVL